MNLKEIKEMLNLMNEHGLTELEVEREGTKIKLKKAALEAALPIAAQPAIPVAPAAAPAPEAPKTEAAADDDSVSINSPMVGTFYRAPSPEAPPYAELGQIVEIGQVVCIVEAMKLMNEIKSEVRGKIVKVAVENAEPVEFGQTLFAVEPL